ncbi:MAG: hypothetical protein AAGF12_13375 [Myxococcota bacterium]
MTLVVWMLLVWGGVGCSEPSTSEASPESPAGEPPEDTPFATLEAVSGADEEAAPPVVAPELSRHPSTEQAGGRCVRSEEQTVVSLAAPIDRFGAAVFGAKGLVAFVKERDTIVLMRVDEQGRVTDSVDRTFPYVSSVQAIHYLDDDVFVLEGRGAGRIHFQAYDSDGAPLGDSRSTHMPSTMWGRASAQSHASRKRVVLVHSHHDFCGFSVERFRYRDGALVPGPVRTPARLWPSCQGIVAHRLLSDLDLAPVLFVVRHWRGTGAVIAVPNEHTRFVRYPGEIRSAVIDDDELLVLSENREGFHLLRTSLEDRPGDEVDLVNEADLPPRLASYLEARLVVRGTELFLERLPATRDRSRYPLEAVGQLATSPRRRLDPPARLVWTGERFMALWVGGTPAAPELRSRIIDCR